MRTCNDVKRLYEYIRDGYGFDRGRSYLSMETREYGTINYCACFVLGDRDVAICGRGAGPMLGKLNAFMRGLEFQFGVM